MPHPKPPHDAPQAPPQGARPEGSRPDGSRPPSSMRRLPVQERSAERLTRILDACAAVLDETGYDGLTTRAVAQRAGVPIGSVYRFFGNKRALTDALAHRNLDAYAERVAARVTGVEHGDWRGAVDAAFDEYLVMMRTVPGFGLVDFGVPSAPDAMPDANSQVADRVAALLALHLNRPLDDALRRTILVGVEVVDAVLQLAFRAAPAGDPALIDEARILLHAYFARSLD
ncbi:TetR family transcriptional regulator [Streptomyces sp. SID335]|uniref:TetR family transcriptional regulator n=2 Tax=Streptomyces TaxID=1883 RepID=A0A5P2B7Q2_STRVZ|nr:TetR family transcriptional regulator [Streptomyces sp. SID335]MYZ18641.1 TetR family transcriptional regulator [Streptomyces sp. SID337]NDZ84004.1 TetR/AcrR family transcriptional regulator [Streptomyces sp. SID10115]NDZ99711.1 TetR/AcrR family transcriptional regulator [Streptomyces sp. SID10116]NEB47389.1 TetR/AcrR family transcriptional regulator [Streptomyces sp. SID339]QES26296.1 TetR family transcriptional regulator [Streptomyces venezuelae]